MPNSHLAVTREAVELDERPGVEQQLDPLACEELPALVLSGDRLLGAGVSRRVAQLPEPGELRLRSLVPGRHRAEPNAAGPQETPW